MSVRIDRRGEELIIQFDYSAQKIKKVKMIERHRWDAEEKSWFVPNTEKNLRFLKRAFAAEQVHIAFEDNTLNESILNLVQEQLKLKAYSHKTKKSYMNHLKRFSSFLQKGLTDTLEIDIRHYLLFLLEENKFSPSYVNQAISSIKFLYCEILNKPDIIIEIPRPKKQRKLPDVLSQEEVMRILESVDNEKHKTILFLVYSAGLRVGEVTRLEIKDVDSNRMLIKVKQGKGQKDRYTVLSEYALNTA